MPEATRRNATPSPWLVLAVLTAGTYASFLNFSLLSPLLPAIAADLDAVPAIVGQLASVSAVVAFCTAVLATPWMDRYSRRSWLRIEAIVLLVGTLVTALSPSLGWLIAGRVIAGFGAAVIGANCLAAVREVFVNDSGQRNRAIGILVSSAMVAFITGLPLLAFVAAVTDWRWAVAVLTIPAGLLLVGSSLLPDTATESSGRTPWAAPFRAVLADRQVVPLYGVLVTVVGAYVGWLVFLGAYAVDRFAMTAGLLGLIYIASGSVELVTNTLTPRVIQAVGAPTMVVAGAALMAIPLLLSGIAVRSVAVVFLAAAAINVGSAAVVIGVNALLLDRARAPGAALSLAAAANELGTAAGPLLAGWMLLRTGDYDIANQVMGALAVIGGLIVVAPGVARLRRDRVAATL